VCKKSAQRTTTRPRNQRINSNWSTRPLADLEENGGCGRRTSRVALCVHSPCGVQLGGANVHGQFNAYGYALNMNSKLIESYSEFVERIYFGISHLL
jgi:hypothetical protein